MQANYNREYKLKIIRFKNCITKLCEQNKMFYDIHSLITSKDFKTKQGVDARISILFSDFQGGMPIKNIIQSLREH